MPRGTGQSPANVTQHLRGMEFPANKQQLLDCAEQNGAPQEILEELERLPERQYQSMSDVMKGYGEIE